MNLGTLGDEDVVAAAFQTNAFNTGSWIISMDAIWSIREFTVGEGPIEVGFADADLTVTQIQEALDIEVIGPAGRIQQEIATRPVRKVGMFTGILAEDVLNDGKPIRRRGSFKLMNTGTVDIWARNKGGSTLTTGAALEISGNLFLNWR